MGLRCEGKVRRKDGREGWSVEKKVSGLAKGRNKVSEVHGL